MTELLGRALGRFCFWLRVLRAYANDEYESRSNDYGETHR